MNSPGGSSLSLALPLGAGALVVAVAAASALLAVAPAPDDARSALQLAFARLRASPSYRVRETIVQPVDGLGGTGVITTEYAGTRSRQVVDFDAPGLGAIHIESVRDGNRAAVRVDVPAFASLLSAGVDGHEAGEARRLFRQLIGVAISAQIDTPASARILALGEDGARARTPAEVRAAMNQARAWFGTWHRNDRHEAMHDDDSGWSRDVVLVGAVRDDLLGSVRRYEQTADGDPRRLAVKRRVAVSPADGLPRVEEIVDVANRTITRVEYLDAGAAIQIELPDCLK